MNITKHAAVLLTDDELKAIPCGHGWDESHTEEGVILQRVAWCDGTFAYRGLTSSMRQVLRKYNKPNGWRIWYGDIPPTEAEMMAKPWGA